MTRVWLGWAVQSWSLTLGFPWFSLVEPADATLAVPENTVILVFFVVVVVVVLATVSHHRAITHVRLSVKSQIRWSSSRRDECRKLVIDAWKLLHIRKKLRQWSRPSINIGLLNAVRHGAVRSLRQLRRISWDSCHLSVFSRLENRIVSSNNISLDRRVS